MTDKEGLNLIRLLLSLLIVLGVSFPVAAGEHFSSFAEQPKDDHGTQGNSDNNDDQQPSGVQVDAFLIESQADLPGAVQEASKLVEAARAENPKIGPVELVEVAGTAGVPALSPPTGQVASSAESAIPHLERSRVEPDRPIEVASESVDTDYFERIGAARIRRTTTTLTVIRTIVAGGVSFIALAVTQMPLPAIISGTIAAAFVSGYMQVKNDYYKKQYLYARAFWDPLDHRDSSKWTWRWAYRGWRFVRESSVIFGYLTAMHWAIALFGAPSNYLTEPLAWLAYTGVNTFYSAVSEGVWHVYDSERRWELFRKNNAENRGNREIAERVAARILVKSQYIAIAVAAVSTMAQVLSVTNHPTWTAWVAPMLWGLGITGGIAYVTRGWDLAERARMFAGSVVACTAKYLRIGRQ